MKILNSIIKRVSNGKHLLKCFSGIFLALLLSSCVDENFNNQDEENGDAVTVEFRIPTIGFGDGNYTRAENGSAVTGNKEGWMANLYLVVVRDPGDDEEKNIVNVYELDTSGYDLKVGSTNNFYVNLYPRHSYKFYLLANFDRYLSRFSHVTDMENEKQVKDLVLNFTADVPLVPSHLPMAARPEDFSMEGVANNNGVLEINSQEITNSDGTVTKKKIVVKADLKFLCSKVRYTILYNNTVGGCSEMFGNNSIRFIVNQSTDRPSAHNIRKQTRFFTDRLPDNFDSEYFYIARTTYISDDIDGVSGATTTSEANWILELNRYKFPTKPDGTPNENYPESSSDNLELWDDRPNLVGWKASEKRAWQGVVYLPENDVLVENSANKGLQNPTNRTINEIKQFTKLVFPYVMEEYVGPDGNYKDADLSDPEAIKKKEISLFGNGADIHYAGDYQSTGNANQIHGLQRGFFYDAVAIVKNPKAEELEMYVKVFVGDHPWIYHDNGGQIW